MTNEHLKSLLENFASIEPGPKFMGKPDVWYDSPHWRCVNEHVSTSYLKSERKGALCLSCFEPVFLSFPTDKDGPIFS